MKLSDLNKKQETLRKKFLKRGVKMIAPETIFFSKDTIIGKNVTIDPYGGLLEKNYLKFQMIKLKKI